MLQILSVPPQKCANNKSLPGAGVSFSFLLITLLLFYVHTCYYITWLDLNKVSLIIVTLMFHLHWFVFFSSVLQHSMTLFHFLSPARWNNWAAASQQPQPRRSAHVWGRSSGREVWDGEPAQLCLCCFAGFTLDAGWTTRFLGWQKSQSADVPASQTTTHSVQPRQYFTNSADYHFVLLNV